MKRIHYLLLGLLVSLTIAAAGPGLPPTRIAPGSGIAITTNGVNNFTVASAVTSNGMFTNVTIYGLGTNALNIPGTNTVGIQTSVAALAPLHVGDYTANSSVQSQILISRLINNANGPGNAHAFSDSSLLGRSGGIGYNSFDARINIGGGVDYDHYAAFQSAPVNVAVGTMQAYYGHYDVLPVNSGNIVNDYGFYKAASVSYGGTIGTIYGVYVAEQTLGTTANYGIYTAGTTPSTFGGVVKVAYLNMAASAAASADVGLYRYAAGVLMVSDGGTTGRRDLMLRELWDTGGNKVVGSRQAAVADAAGGAVVDVEARAALNSLLAKLRTHGLIAP